MPTCFCNGRHITRQEEAAATALAVECTGGLVGERRERVVGARRSGERELRTAPESDA